ncbi:hypothetical protein [Hymenobacter tenuis]
MPLNESSPAALLPADRRAYGLLLGLLLVSLVTAFVTQSTFDSSDSILHYVFARYAFAHPINFLESWSKPLVVELMAVPALFGLRGVMVYQCLVVAAAAGLAYEAARYLRLPWPWLAILFCYASPEYFRIQFSGLTEPTFSLVLMAGVALALRGKAGWGAVVLSFLPFARSEGYLIVGVYAFYLVVTQKWRALPWLGLGFVVYGVVGLFVYDDFLWAFSRNAYPTRNVNYGHGDAWHYIRSLPNTMGWVLYGLFWLGGLRMLGEWARPALRRQPVCFTAELLLIYGSVVVFVAAHTIFWVYGIFGSFGMARVLCGIAPLLSLIALRGVVALSELAQTPLAQRRIQTVLAVAVVGFLFCGSRASFRWQRDFGRAADQILIEEAAVWALERGNPPHVAYTHPYFGLALHTDPFGPHRSEISAVRDTSWPLPKGTLVFWDDWHSIMEGQVPFALLQQDPNYRLLWKKVMARNQRKPIPDSVRIAIFEKIN